ncbi:MAG: glycosyltransferase family 2 protein, partial [Bacteroidales bacterium]|nr:glycosyltransferase family 2 protein [Bacteroidales bacterium]
EAHIEDCILSLKQICNEIIVVDSGSRDRTMEIAQSLGAKTYSQSYLGDGIQKNVALKYVSNQWVISIDADERISPELAAEIQSLDLESTPYDAFAVKRKNYIGSRWVKCCHWYPDYLIRVYRHDKTRFAEVKQHAYVPSANYKKLNSALEHLRYNNIGEVFSKPERNYSTRGAKILYLKGKRANAFSPVLHGLGAFFTNYFLRGGILGGIDGLSLSLAIANNSYLKYAKLLEYQRDSKVLEAEDFDRVW